MYFHRLILSYATCFSILIYTTLSAPAHSVPKMALDADTSLSNKILNTIKHSRGQSIQPAMAQRINDRALGLASTTSVSNHSAQLEFTTVNWDITNTLYLTINIGPWRLSPERILETMEAAETAVGKKQGSVLLDGKFTQEQGSRVNTMLFEITPGLTDRLLTWADVAEVLGEDGLPGFFQQERYWYSTYFDVMHKERGKLGYGALRKWYQLEPPNGSNSTDISSGDIVVV